MGWTFLRPTREQLINHLIASEDSERASCEVLRHAVVGNVLWSVRRVTAKVPDVMGLAVGASINLIDCYLLEPGHEGWGYKWLSEADHPFYYSCPLRFLAMAPTQSEAWRKLVISSQAEPAA